MPRHARIPEKAGWRRPGALPKGPNGRALCRQCSTEVPKGRLTFCSDACVHAWKMVTDPNYQMLQVAKRDQGVCQVCRVDTRALEREWTALLPLPDIPHPWYTGAESRRHWDRSEANWAQVTAAVREIATQHPGFAQCLSGTTTWERVSAGRSGSSWTLVHRSLWDMDHRVEVVHGGAGLPAEKQLDNLQTLCIVCHKIKTARLAAMRARLRAFAKALVRLGTTTETRP